jgi:hypothetical protein
LPSPSGGEDLTGLDALRDGLDVGVGGCSLFLGSIRKCPEFGMLSKIDALEYAGSSPQRLVALLLISR